MGELLILLEAPDVSYPDPFGTAYSLTHRGIWFSVSPFRIGDERGQRGDRERIVLTACSALGRMVGEEFRALPASQVTTGHTEADLKGILAGPGSFVAGVVALHLAALAALELRP